MPYSSAIMISVAVTQPGRTGMFFFWHSSTTGRLKPGMTTNFAPLSITSSAILTLSTLPAPTTMPGSSFAMRPMFPRDSPLRISTSTTGSPPSISACAAGTTDSALMSAMIGQIAVSFKRSIRSLIPHFSLLFFRQFKPDFKHPGKFHQVVGHDIVQYEHSALFGGMVLRPFHFARKIDAVGTGRPVGGTEFARQTIHALLEQVERKQLADVDCD